MREPVLTNGQDPIASSAMRINVESPVFEKPTKGSPTSRIWRHGPIDSWLLGLSAAHTSTNVYLAKTWASSSPFMRCISFLLTVCMTVYNIVVISHIFVHRPWFRSRKMNAVVSLLNSVNAGQSIMAYRLLHVRNHHRYNNDRQGPDGATKDLSSTYRRGKNGQHEGLGSYVLCGALLSAGEQFRALIRIDRGWRVDDRDATLVGLAATDPAKRAGELRQIQLDRAAVAISLCGLSLLSWQWTLACWAPATVVAFALVNIQNYFEHYGGDPQVRGANAVSHYGPLYNLLTFNDGFHQEHHLRPGAHWTELVAVRSQLEQRQHASVRVVSPVPAILGFLDRNRRRGRR